MAGRADALVLASPDGAVDVDADLQADTGVAAGGFWYDEEGGYYTRTVTVLRAGEVELRVADAGGAAPVTGSRTLRVRAAAPARLNLAGARDGVVALPAGQVTQFTLQAEDAYGNPVDLPGALEVAVETTPGLSVRLAPDGANITGLTLARPTALYLAAGAAGAQALVLAGELAAELAVDVRCARTPAAWWTPWWSPAGPAPPRAPTCCSPPPP